MTKDSRTPPAEAAALPRPIAIKPVILSGLFLAFALGILTQASHAGIVTATSPADVVKTAPKADATAGLRKTSGALAPATPISK
ncbi:MAG: hypothetical protein AAFY65_06435 [Pseudomonadota bacterium]